MGSLWIKRGIIMYRIMKIYYEITTGELIWMTSYNYEAVVDFESDYSVVKVLNDRVKESIGLLILENGLYHQDFEEGSLKGVDPVTLVPLFEYHDPEEPGVIRRPLTVEVDELRDDLNESVMELSMLIAMGGM